MIACLLGSGACGGGEDPPNMLPSGSGTSDPSTTEITADTTAAPPVSFPATYRFDCIDIIELGDSDNDGQPDGGAIQANVLEGVWGDDIADYKLNVMLAVRDRDEAAGTATVVVGSGIGATADALCTEPTTAGAEQTAGFELGTGQWQPSGTPGTCADPASGEGFGGTYSFELSAADTIYVYAEDDDGTVFNCVPGGASPDAVPLHAVRATVTVDATEQISAGQLTGCLVDTEAQALCSCLDECSGIPHADCGGCPDGATPLAELLGDVGTTEPCTQIMGEPAYDLTVGFTTTRLSIDEPMTCGG